MIKLIADLPANVVAFTASGRVSAADYENTIIPLVDEKIGQHGNIRLLYHLGPDFKKFTTTALWDDAKIGFHHLRSFERVAVVSDVPWIQKMISGIGRALPAEVRSFAHDELDQAKTWISE